MENDIQEKVFEEVNAEINESIDEAKTKLAEQDFGCLLYTSPSPRDGLLSRMPSSA